MADGEEMSIKGMFQAMIPTQSELLMGNVIQTGPLKIQVKGDSKLIISEVSTIVAWHLSDYTTKADIAVDEGELASLTVSGGSHNHDGGSHSGHQSGNGEHSHDGGSHTHDLDTFVLTNATITVHNALKVGDVVHLLALQDGKLYYVLDRVNNG